MRPKSINGLPDEIIIPIFLNINGHPKDSIRLRAVCKRFQNIFAEKETELAVVCAKSLTGIVRIVYENLCGDEDKPFEHGFAMIQKTKCRANDIHILMDKFEKLGCMPVYQKMVGIDLCETDDKALHLRRKMETIMLGLEI